MLDLIESKTVHKDGEGDRQGIIQEFNLDVGSHVTITHMMQAGQFGVRGGCNLSFNYTHHTPSSPLFFYTFFLDTRI